MVYMYVTHWMLNSVYGITFLLIAMAPLVMMMMILMKVMMIVDDDSNLQINDYDLWFNISRNIQGQEHAMEHLETSNTLPVSQTLGFLLDWTN